MHKSEPRDNSTFIIHANKVYELRAGTIGTHRVLAPSEYNYEVDLVSYVNNNETPSPRVHDLLSIVFSLPMNRCLLSNKVKAISLSRLPLPFLSYISSYCVFN